MNPEFIIRIIVRARNEIAGVMDKAAGDVERLTKAEDRHTESARRSTRATKDQQHEFDTLGRTIRNTSTEAERGHGALRRLFTIDPGKMRELDDVASRFERTLNRNNFSVGALNTRLRGFLVLGVIAFFQQIVSVTSALAGTLVSLASTAAQAGAALGGMATAGAAQAIPVIGLLVAAWGRVGAVFKAVQQATKETTQAGYNHTQQMDRQASAADAVKQAEEGVAQAHRRVTETTLQLTKARRDAQRQVEDLLAAEEKARLQSQAAALSEIDARRTLRQSISTGAVDEQARNELDVLSTAQQRRESNRQLQRAGQDANEARRRSPLGPQGGIDQAESSLADARRGVDSAERALSRARREAANTQKQMAATQRTLDQMLAQLSPAERQLYEAMRRLQATYKQIFRPITDIVVGGFTDAVGKVTHMLGDKRITEMFTGIAQTVRSQMGRITAEMSSERSFNFWTRMGKEAERNLPVLTTIGIQFNRIFQNIATAASPALRKFLDFLAELTTKGARATGSDSGLSKLERFFLRGEAMAESIIHLTGAVFHLFGAIIGAGAKEGQNSIDAMTDSINRAADWIETHQRKVQAFFHGAAQATGFVARAVWELVKALGSLYHPDQVRLLANAFTASFLPALTAVARAVGVVTGLFLRLAGTPIGSAFTQLIITTTLLFKIFSPLTLMSARLLREFGLLFGSTRLLAAGFRVVQLSTGPFGIALAAIAAAIILIDQRFHIIRPSFVALAGALGILAAAFNSTLRAQAAWMVGLSAARIVNAVQAVRGLIAVMGLLRVAMISTGIGAILVALGTLAAFMIRNQQKTDEAAAAQRRFRNAIRDSKNAIQGYSDALGDLTDANLSHRAAVLNLRSAEDNLRRVRNDPRSKPLDIKQAELTLDQARRDVQKSTLQVAQAERRATNEREHAKRTLRDNAPYTLHGRQLRTLAELATRGAHRYKDLRTAFNNLADSTTPLRRRISLLQDALDKLPRRKQIKLLVDLAYDGALPKLTPINKLPTGGARRGGGSGKQHELLKTFFDFFGIELPAGLSTGGPVGAGFGGGDRVPILGEAGEHMWSKEEVRAAGGHGAMQALRSFFGGGGQSAGRRMAVGGAVRKADKSDNKVDLDGSAFKAVLDIVDSYGGRIRKSWGNTWDDITSTTRVGARRITKLVDNMADDGIVDLRRFAKRGDDAVEALVKQITRSMNSLQDVVFDAMSYVGGTANKALKAFDAKPVRLSLDRPGKGKAEGGFMGMAGERGRDTIATWLGRGEAVLNWAQQKAIAPALAWAKNAGRSPYGSLQEVFSGVRAYHAGGPEQPGLARGGGDLFDGHPSNVSSAIKNLIELMKKHFPRLHVGSTTDHGLTRSGRPSDHQSGDAVDLGDGTGGSEYMNRAAAWVKSSGLYKRLKQGIHNPNLAVNAGKLVSPSFYSGDWAGHLDHLHLALVGALRGHFGDAVENVKRAIIRGPAGGAKGLAQHVSDRVRKAANRLIESKSAEADPGGGAFSLGKVATGPRVRSIFDFFRGKGLSAEAASGILGNMSVESGFRTVAPESGFHGIVQWDEGRWGQLVQRAKQWKMDPNSLKAQLNNVWYELTHGYTGALRHLKGARSPGEAAAVWDKEYEISAGTSRGQRMSEAEKFFAQLRRRHATGGFVGGIQGFARGGEVQGPHGHAVPIIAHAKEWVLNQMQQTKLAGWLGTTRNKLGGMLGLRGGKSSFADGGIVGKRQYNQEELQELWIALGGSPKLARVAAAIMWRESRGKARARNVNKDGSVDRGLAQINSVWGKLSTYDPIKNVQNAVRIQHREGWSPWRVRGGSHLTGTHLPRGLTRAQIEDAQKGDVKGQAERGLLERLVPTIHAIDVGGLRKSSTKVIAFMRGLDRKSKSFMKNFSAGFQILAGDQGLLDQMNAAIERLTTHLASNLKRATFKINRKGQAIRRLSESTVADRELHNLERVYRGLMGERGVINNSMRLMTRRINRLRRRGVSDDERPTYEKLVGFRRALRDRRDIVETSLGENLEQRYQAAETAINARTTAADERATAGTSNVDARQRVLAMVGTRLGGAWGISSMGLARERQGVLQTQVNELSGAMRLARRRGRGDLAAKLATQIQDLQVQMAEAVQQGLQAALDDITNRATRAQTSLDLRNRLADVVEKSGNFVAAFQQRGAALQQRSRNLQGQRGELQGLLRQAAAAGQFVLVDQLTDQLAELDVSLKENTAAIVANTVAARQAAIDNIIRRGGFLGGVFNNLSAFLTAVGVNTGTVDTKRQIGLLGQTGTTLGQTGTNLRQQLFEAFGVDVRGYDAPRLVDALSKLNFDGIEAKFTTDQRDQFENLINSVVENATATEQNTTALKELTQPVTQSWSSTAWQLFRQAIFTGSGGLLPQYRIPSLQSGGIITQSGLAYLHSGEPVGAAAVKHIEENGNGGRVAENVNVYIDHPVEILDEDSVGQRLAWKLKTTPRG